MWMYLVTPVKNDYICTLKLQVLAWYEGHGLGILRVMKRNFFDLDEGILRNLDFKIWTPFRLKPSEEPILEQCGNVYTHSFRCSYTRGFVAHVQGTRFPYRFLWFEPYRDQLFITFCQTLYFFRFFVVDLGERGFESCSKMAFLPRPASLMRPPFLYHAP